MKLYPENYDVTIRVSFVDLNGAKITPSEVRAVLFNGEDEVVVNFGSLPFDPLETGKDIVIPAAFNILGEGALSEARILKVQLTTNAGIIRYSSVYAIEGEFRLAVMENSFMSIEAAELLARDIPNLKGWSEATEESRNAALINAFERLIRIPMKFKRYEGVEMRHYEETVIPTDAWREITKIEFMTFPASFRKAVRQAQIAEANEILENDVTASKHRAGIISETVGESSVMLRGGLLELGIAKRSSEFLKGHIYYRARLLRG
ncbi:hypothetical protein [Phyllobacterium myrsinacearum]|uniref:Uncharacterized protein n=1 Tax=Phyllobacterium myrsinacearum TaxID=28101 RepID=A0A839EMD0_9HYPH|nr:hypothetical protein [Phyllobacterium myrsinacearum]MBA8881723.1 hypothetical protein [Phyllobacterium myrsinacearum]